MDISHIEGQHPTSFPISGHSRNLRRRDDSLLRLPRRLFHAPQTRTCTPRRHNFCQASACRTDSSRIRLSHPAHHSGAACRIQPPARCRDGSSSRTAFRPGRVKTSSGLSPHLHPIWPAANLASSCPVGWSRRCAAPSGTAPRCRPHSSASRTPPARCPARPLRSRWSLRLSRS